MPTPLPPPGIHVRAAVPPNLSMRLVEQAGHAPPAAPFALFGGITPPLRKVVQKPLFEVGSYLSVFAVTAVDMATLTLRLLVL